MPDIDFQKISLNLIPKKGDEPVIFYASQYESARPFIAKLFWDETEFAPGDDCWAEIDIRKNDNNLVVITDDVTIDNNEVSVILPVQALTCIGKNLGQVKIYAADDHLIAALNFILEVQPDPLAGGVDSETAIDNLESQIAAIVPEVIGEDYYDKTEVDNLLADKADVSDLPDMSNYYNKTETDTLLNGKADASTTYTKTEVDNALALKANSADLATVATTGDYDDLINKPVLPDMTQYYIKSETDTLLAAKANSSDVYTKSQVDDLIDNIFPTFTASGALATFTTALTKPLVSVTADPLATAITRCGKNLLPFYTFSSGGGINITSNNGTYNISGTTTGYFQLIAPTSFILKAGTYTLNSNGSNTNSLSVQLRSADGLMTYAESALNSDTFTINADTEVKFRITFNNANSYSATISPQLEVGSTATAFESYNVQTVPVADATNITTLSGVNNVYADAGSVTAQYKYMSM